MPKREEIRIRDPFILPDRKRGKYYMYGTTALYQDDLSAGASLSVYESEDLQEFSPAKEVFNGEGFWADRDYWAPEVHYYNGKYYMFVSLKSQTRCRGTQILVCDTPDGRFRPLTKYPVTPEGWECLDGTFWIEDGTPYIVFSHEWLQTGDGEIWSMPLSADLTHAVGEAKLLFKASDNPYIVPFRGEKFEKCYVTDGPFLYKENGKLNMLWSSRSEDRYCILHAEAESIHGEWRHSTRPIFERNGGHAMLFCGLDGKKYISFHYPDTPTLERLRISEWKEGSK